jgi:serine protease AprX
MPDLRAEDTELRDAARKFTRQKFGSAMETKASDAFCIELLDKRQDVRGGVGLEVVGGGPPVSAIVEFEPPEALAPMADAKSTPKRRRGPRAEPESAETSAQMPLLVHARTTNDQAMAEVFNAIEFQSGTRVGPAPEYVGIPAIPTTVTQRCWLNRTLRTWAGPEALAVVMGHESVTQVDLPRRLVAEATPINHTTIKLPDFVARTNLTGKGVIVAVIDSEAAREHPAYSGRIEQRRNFTAENWGNPHSHGTAVVGLIAADNPDAGGVAPEVRIWNYKVLATNSVLNGDDFDGALALQQALEDGARIANCSWGVGEAATAKSREAIAVDAAWSLGMVVVKSAGNNGPAKRSITSPAEADGVIVVGATNLAGTKIADYSSRGPAGSLKRPHIVAPGGGDDGSLVCARVSGGFGDAGQGTSYAAPQVAGAVALLREESADITPDQVRDKLTSSAMSLSGVAADAQGSGLMQLS